MVLQACECGGRLRVGIVRTHCRRREAVCEELYNVRGWLCVDESGFVRV